MRASSLLPLGVLSAVLLGCSSPILPDEQSVLLELRPSQVVPGAVISGALINQSDEVVGSGILPCTAELERLDGEAWVDVAPPQECELPLVLQRPNTKLAFHLVAPDAPGTYRLSVTVSLEESRPLGATLLIHSLPFEVVED